MGPCKPFILECCQRELTMVVQINTFHWYVVDSQSFPLVVPGSTDIAEKAAYSADAVYTPQDVAHIVSYAGQVHPPLFPSSSIQPKLTLP
jgi:hypothetical protein